MDEGGFYELSIRRICQSVSRVTSFHQPATLRFTNERGKGPQLKVWRTEPDQKYEQIEYPRILDSATVVRKHEMLPLYWHSKKREYIGGWQTQDTYDRLGMGKYFYEHKFIS